MDLDTWQIRLESRFEELAYKRSSTTGTSHIFSLEHGLDESEIKLIDEAVRAHIKSWKPSMDHWLPWIVYATELGYQYSGSEYWQTFEMKTPGWTEHGSPTWIRECYKRFCDKYGGVRPTGKWANHFSIICWPITNAILPQDLQRQLAYVLYKIRHLYSEEMFESPLLLGNIIAAHSLSQSDRFRNFAQETQLAGQISAALLLEGVLNTSDLLCHSTLQRISQDLDSIRQRRTWLREARNYARKRTRVHGLRKPIGFHKPRTKEEAREEVENLGIEPRLILKPISDNCTSWNVSLEIPNLSNLYRRFPDTQHILEHSRCHITGTDSRPIARGHFLWGSQRLTLRSWPNADEVLLRFEKSNSGLEFLLKTECMFRPGPPWLFRIASDGLAYECRGLGVRSGQQYIILAPKSAISADIAKPVKIQCKGIRATLLHLPTELNSDVEEVIKNLGLKLSRQIRVWPAGLSPINWDGEGYSEWLEGEHPAFSIQCDHALSMVRMRLDSPCSQTVEFNRVIPGETFFVKLPPLPVGLYSMYVDEIETGTGDAETLGHLKVRVLKRREGPLGLKPSGPLRVYINPIVPTLEKLWDGQVDLEIVGPHGQVVQCELSLINRNKERPLARIATSMKLPVTSIQWRGRFEKLFREKPNVFTKYDLAHMCQVELSAGKFGAFKFLCEREFTPLRWVQSGHDTVRLIDDSGIEGAPQVSHYMFEKPADKIDLNSDLEYEVTTPGGLYFAKKGEFTTGLIASLNKSNRLSDYSISPGILPEKRSLDAAVKAIKLSYEWATARSSGNILSAICRGKSLRAFTQHISGLIAGENWEKAESEFKKNHNLQLMSSVIEKKMGSEFGSSLESEITELARKSIGRRVKWLTRLLARHGVLHMLKGSISNRQDLERITEFSLRLCSSPKDAKDWLENNVREEVNLLLQAPAILCAARFLVLATHECIDSDGNVHEVYRGWEW